MNTPQETASTEAPTPEPKPKRRGPLGPVRSGHIIAILLAVAATLWVASGAVTGTAPTPEETAAKNEPKAPLTLVRVSPSRAQTHVSHIRLFGRTEAVTNIELAAETAGKVVERPVEKGMRVTKGTPILKIAIDDRMARLKEAEAKVDYQQLSYDSAMKLSKKQFSSTIKVAEEKAALEAAKAALAAIRLDLSRTTVRAPIDGFVETLPVNVGDFVQSGTIVAGMVELDPMRVVGQVSERQVAYLKVGDKAWAMLPGGISREGTVRFVSRTAQETTRTFRVEVWFDNPDGLIAQGMTAELRLPLDTALAHRVSPAILTLDERGVIGVKAVDAEDTVVFHPVELIEDTTEGVWIGGLPDELTLITVGQEFVRPGQKVRIKPEAADSAAGNEASAEGRSGT
jgi:multidrug efflux system membrane fusion protein